MSRLSYLTVYKFRIVVETRRNRPRMFRDRWVPVCGYSAGYLGLGLAQLGQLRSFLAGCLKVFGIAQPSKGQVRC